MIEAAAFDVAVSALKLDEYLRQSGDDTTTPEFKELGEELTEVLGVFREAYKAEYGEAEQVLERLLCAVGEN